MGEWKNNLQNGEGIHIWMDSKGENKELRNRYEGQWLNGSRHGYGTFYYADGSKYEGEWKNNQKEGCGILTESSGELVVGEFKADKYIQPKDDTQNSKQQGKKITKKKTATLQQQQQQQESKPAKKQVKFKQDEDKKLQEENQKKMEQLLKEERKRKLELQMNPYSLQIDIYDLTELYPESRLQIYSDLTQVLLRHNSTIKGLYKSILQKYENSIGENAFCMDLKGFWQFCRDQKILDASLTLASINRLFFQGSKNKFEINQSQESIERKVAMAKQFKQKQKKFTNKELSNIQMVEMLTEIQQNKQIPDVFKLNDQEFEKQMNQNMNQSVLQSQTVIIDNDNNTFSKNGVQNIHDGQRPILIRHFTDLLIRTAYLKYGDPLKLGEYVEKLIFEKIIAQIEKQRDKKLQSQTGSKDVNSSNPSQVKSSSVNISFLEDTDFTARYKKAQESFNSEIQQAFDFLAEDNRSQKYGIIDRTCKIKQIYKLLMNCGYIKELNDKHVLFHVVEKCYDPSSLIATLDQQLKNADRNNINQLKKSKNINTKLKAFIDKQKQLKLIVMLNSEVINYEFSELLMNFLCRKDKDMAHTKNEDMFKKKLGVHIQRIIQCIKQDDQQTNDGIQKQKKKKMALVWPTTQKDVMKTELAKERVIKNKLVLEQQKEKEQKLREARERLQMEKEDQNAPDQNEEDYEYFDESEIEVFDDDYLANF